MWYEYLLLGLFLFFIVRIVMKRNGGSGLIAPIIIVFLSGGFLLVGTTKVVIGVIVGCIIMALYFRNLFRSETI